MPRPGHLGVARSGYPTTRVRGSAPLSAGMRPCGVAIRTRQGTAAERLERLLELQSLLAEVSRRIGPALELSPVLQTVLAAMRSMVEFRGGTIQLIDDQGLYIAASDPPVTPELAATRLPLGSGLSGRAVATRTPIYCPDLDFDERVDPRQRRTGNNATTHSYLVVPLIVLGDCIGAMQVDSNEIDAFDAEDMAVLEGLSTQVAGAIESARRYEEMLELKRLKDNFIALISHELRTPLTIISGFTQTLAANDERLSPADRKYAVEALERAVERFKGLVEHTLYVSRLDARVNEPNLTEVSLAELATSVRDRSVDPANVTHDIHPGVTLIADRELLDHLLGQLVDNALKYGGDAAVSVDVDDEHVTIRVRDHGPGFPEDQRELAFERFVRGQHPGSGMGLGLATVQQLASVLGAKVRIADCDGDGTEVSVTIRL